MAYNEIQPAAFVPDPAAGPFFAAHQALAFPAPWREPVLDLYRHGRAWPERIRQVPVHRLNTVIRAVAPDLVSVASYAPLDGSRPWLYADTEYPTALMNTFVHAWLRDMQPSPEAYPLFKATVRNLDVASLRWELTGVDMLEQALSEDGTAQPAQHLFQLLPTTLAARIAALPAYEHGGHRLDFRQVAGGPGSGSAELVSWPPLEYTPRGGGGRTWRYSAYIRVSLRTAPFSPVPRIHLSTGVRRWVGGQVWMPTNRGVSVYLLADGSLVADGPVSQRFATASLVWDRKTGGTKWAQGGPAGMLRQVGALDNLPLPEVLAKEPDTWIGGRDGVTAAVVHHSMMGSHGVRPGLMPAERRRLVEWAAEALKPQFRQLGPLHRSEVRDRGQVRALEPRLGQPKKASDEERARIAERNEGIDARNAEERRPRVASALEGNGLTAFVLYQKDSTRDLLISAAERSLGLVGHRVRTGPTTWSWNTPELAVRIEARPLGGLGGALGGARAPRRNHEWDGAIGERRRDVRDFLRQQQDAAGAAQVVLVELEGRENFKKRTTDPKGAIRLGAADAGVVSQFIRPTDPGEDGAVHRADAAWGDALRQLGWRLVPRHSLGAAIPDELNQLAFWLVKRQIGGDSRRPQFTPVAVLIRPGQECVMGRSAGQQDWVPYPELLKGLTGQVRDDDLRSRPRQADATAAFVKQTLYKLRGEPTLVVTHAQNTRGCWDWLTNGGLTRDRIRIGNGPLQRLALHGRRLRIARIASGQRDETPQWWAPKPGQAAGLSKGLWVPKGEDDANRVFYSTPEKASTHQVPHDVSKLTPHPGPRGEHRIRPSDMAWNPELLELAMVGLQPGDDAEQWAMYLHQQRSAEDYKDSLGLPLVLHLAQLTSRYALPHADMEEEAPVAPPAPDSSGTSEQLTFGWDVADD